MDESSSYLWKEPCPECGSKDNLARYSDGHAHCFGCKRYEPGEGGEPEYQSHYTLNMKAAHMDSDLIEGEYRALKARGITEETCRKFGYKVGTYSKQTVHINPYHDEDGNLIAQKLRFADKEVMPWLGKSRKPRFFGQHLPIKSTRKLVVTEGELDALSVSQVQGNKWPVVSLPLGAAGGANTFKQELKFLCQFDEVILMFDEDEPGRAAAKACAQLLPPGTAKIATLLMKDANELLVAGRGDEITSSIFGAVPYRPEGLLSGKAIKDRLAARPTVVSYPFPENLSGLNDKTYGLRLYELTVWTSGTGMGKTTMIKQLQHHFLQSTEFNQALIHLEEPLEDTADGLVGLHLGRRIQLPDIRADTPQEDIDRATDEVFDAVDGDELPRLQLYDAFGALGDDTLYYQIRFCALALNCKIVWLDHLSILVSNMGDDGDERKRIDSIMHNLTVLAVELGISIHLISHLKKAPQGKSFEEGYVPSLDDLRGSGGIKQLSWNVFALSRDQQHDNAEARNTSTITVLKCRYTGRTGTAAWLLFDDLTGRMGAGQNPDNLVDFPDDDRGVDLADPFVAQEEEKVNPNADENARKGVKPIRYDDDIPF
jgi:twinkle protein